MRPSDLEGKELLQHLLSLGLAHNNCLVWPRATTRTTLEEESYGRVFWRGKHYLVHRLVYSLVNEVLLKPTDKVCHTCDNSLCYKPSHLFRGTQKQNVADAIAKGRHRIPRLTGANHPGAVLKLCEVEDIRRLYATGIPSQSFLGKMFNIGQSVISMIVNNKAWQAI